MPNQETKHNKKTTSKKKSSKNDTKKQKKSSKSISKSKVKRTKISVKKEKIKKTKEQKSKKKEKSKKSKYKIPKKEEKAGKGRIDHRVRKNIKVGSWVKVEVGRGLPLKKGKVAKILTNVKEHEYGIKVELESGDIGRVQEVLDKK
ncbi:MAG: DUF2196 domain-containing protein [Promethearchaeota archaeon]